MYLSHFGLNEPPFKITPVTEFFYSGANRGAVLEALAYAISHGEGIVKVVGEVGSGKTMLCRVLIERLPETVETIYLANPSLSRDEILYAIADELRVDVAGLRVTAVLKALADALIERYGAGKRVVLLIDEAHAMPLDTLEEIRLLSNLETSRNKLLQIVLFGQPELDANLALLQMRQLKDRIIHHFTMQPLAAPVVQDYLMFRMRAAGYKGPDLFAPGAVKLIAKYSGGLTRRVNILADKALLAAFVGNTHAVEARHVKAAIQDSEFGPRHASGLPPAWLAVLGLAALAIAGAAWFLFSQPAPAPGAVAPAPQPASPAAAPAEPRSEAPAPPAAPPAVAAPPVAPTTALAPVTPAPAPQAAPAPAAAAPAAVSAPHAAPAPAPAPAAAPAPRQPPRAEAPPAKAEAPEHRLLNERLAETRKAFAAAPGSHYTIHLFVTTEARPERIEAFLIRAQRAVNLAEVYVQPARAGGKNRFRVMYGIYPTREEARAALEQLPQKYQSSFRLELHTLTQIRLVS